MSLWINLENMKKIASELDYHHTLEELKIDENVVMDMVCALVDFLEESEKEKVETEELINSFI